MSCPSAICTLLTNTAVAANGSAGFGSTVRRYGPSCQLNGMGINLVGGGYYKLDASMSLTPTATGPVTLTFYQDGMALVSMTAQGTEAEPVVLSVPFMLRNCGCDCNSTLTYTVSAAGTINSFPVTVEKK